MHESPTATAFQKASQLVLGGLFAALLGCSGDISDAPREGSGSGPEPNGSRPKGTDPRGTGSGGVSPGQPSEDPAEAAVVPGPAPLRRLTALEYGNTIRDLLGVELDSIPDLGIDQESGLSGFAKGGPIATAADSERLLAAAEQASQAALARLEALLPCSPGSAPAAEDDCARAFIEGFGRRAFRRPLFQEEAEDLFTVYRTHRAAELGQDFPQAVGAVLTAMLLAPQFLYHWELGEPAPRDGELVRFGPHETASRLSYLFWASMPDETLFAAADAGRLASVDEIEAQARRLLADPRAADAVASFHEQWLELGGLPWVQKDPAFADFTSELVASLREETRRFATQVVAGVKAGGLEALLTSAQSFVDQRLAKLYGITGPTGSEVAPVTLDAAERAGVLTRAGFLATHAAAGQSHPVRRGVVVLGRLLCTEVAPPPDMDVGQVEPPAEGLTTRGRYAAHAENACATCHRLTDPIGFAFEHYDAIGAYRETDQGQPVDATGSMELDGKEVRFRDAIELSRALADSQQVRGCVVRQWLRYALGRREVGSEAGSIATIERAFADSSYDLGELLVAITRTRVFSHRTPSPGEVLRP